MSDVIGWIVLVVVMMAMLLSVIIPVVVGEETIRNAKKKGVIK